MKSLNSIIYVFAAMSLAGLLCLITYQLNGLAWLRQTGYILIAPLLITGVLIGLVLVPFLMFMNRRK